MEKRRNIDIADIQGNLPVKRRKEHPVEIRLPAYFGDNILNTSPLNRNGSFARTVHPDLVGSKKVPGLER